MNRNEKLRICIVGSAGGHLNQLLKLIDSWQGRDAFYVTTTAVVREKLSKLGRVYVVGECNREHPIQVVKVLLCCISIVFKERPNVMISTGAAAGCMLSLLGKILGAKVIWIDSITNVERISLSGRIVRYTADLFLVQWPELAGRYKKVEFVGSIV